MLDNDYLEFRKNAKECNLVSKAVVACCGSKSDLFQAEINGDIHQYPVTVPNEIVEKPQINNSNDKEYINHNQGVLDDFVVEKAYHANDEIETAEISDYVWNGNVTALEYTPSGFNTIQSDYFTKLSIQRQRSQDIPKILYDTDITPKSSIETIKNNVDDREMSLFQDQCNTVESLLSSILYPGAGMLTVLNTGDDYVAIFGKLSKESTKHPGCMSFAPGGVISTENCRNDPIRDTMFIEFAEEIYGVSEERTDTLESTPVLELKRLIDAGEAYLDHTGVMLNPLNGVIDFNGLLFIDSPSYYEQKFKPNLDENYEYSNLELVSLTNTRRLENILDLETVRPDSAYCIIKGLDVMERKYGIPIGIDININ